MSPTTHWRNVSLVAIYLGLVIWGIDWIFPSLGPAIGFRSFGTLPNFTSIWLVGWVISLIVTDTIHTYRKGPFAD